MFLTVICVFAVLCSMNVRPYKCMASRHVVFRSRFDLHFHSIAHDGALVYRVHDGPHTQCPGCASDFVRP